METDGKIIENNQASQSAETPRRKNKKQAVNWQAIIVVVAVVAVLGFIVSYSAITGDASLCITTKPAEKIQQIITEKEPYTAYKEVDAPFAYTIVSELQGYDTYNYINKKFGKVEIKNTDEHSGVFTVIGNFIFDGKEEKQILNYDVPPEKTKLFYFEYYDKNRDTDRANFTYEILPPTKRVNKALTEYRETEKIKETKTAPEVACL